MPDLLVIVPTRGRPTAVDRVVAAWNDTDAWADAELRFVVDADDPAVNDYKTAFHRVPLPDPTVRGPVCMTVADRWRPLVPKLNLAAVAWAAEPYLAVGFAGDDHLPRTAGWAHRYVEALRELGTGIVYGNDLLQGERLPTQWAMTVDIVHALGRMVPADVEHLYCDNAVKDLGQLAGCLRYLPDVVVEHVHPIARKTGWDAGYRQANAPSQYRRDRLAYQRWLRNQADADVAAVRALREVTVGG